VPATTSVLFFADPAAYFFDRLLVVECIIVVPKYAVRCIGEKSPKIDPAIAVIFNE
jgi:hypothetical protein